MKRRIANVLIAFGVLWLVVVACAEWVPPSADTVDSVVRK